MDALFCLLGQESCKIVKVMSMWTVSPKGWVILFISFKEHMTPGQIFLFVFISSSSVSLFLSSPSLMPFLSPSLFSFSDSFFLLLSPPKSLNFVFFLCLLTWSLPVEAKLALSSLDSQGWPQISYLPVCLLSLELTNVSHEAQFQVKFPRALEVEENPQNYVVLFVPLFPWVSNSSVLKYL